MFLCFSERRWSSGSCLRSAKGGGQKEKELSGKKRRPHGPAVRHAEALTDLIKHYSEPLSMPQPHISPVSAIPVDTLCDRLSTKREQRTSLRHNAVMRQSRFQLQSRGFELQKPSCNASHLAVRSKNLNSKLAPSATIRTRAMWRQKTNRTSTLSANAISDISARPPGE